MPLPVPMGDPGEVPGTMKTDLGLEQGGKADSEGLSLESFPIKHAVEPDEPAARDVLRDLARLLDDGLTKHDSSHDSIEGVC